MKRLRLVDSGMHNLNAPAVTRTVRARSQRLARRLFDTYQPDVLVFEQFNYPGSRRSRHLPAVTAAFKALAKQRGISVVEYTPQEIKDTLAPTGIQLTKAALCQRLARRYPRLKRYLPRKPHSIGDAEPHYTNLFMAVALGLTWARQHLSRRR